jgi:peroxiredoxin
MPAPRIKRHALFGAVVVVTGLVGVGYLRLLRPAHARELQAACRALAVTPGTAGPSRNKALGALPRPALDFTVQDREGAPVKLSDFRGRVVILNFWASWCETCEKEKDSLDELQRLHGDDLVVLKVASDLDWNKVKARFPQGTAMTVAVDPPAEEGLMGPVTKSYGVGKVPETFLIDRDGSIRHYVVNKRDWSTGIVATCLRSLLDES